MAKKKLQAVLGVMQAVRREFEGMSVEDAKTDLPIVVNSEEVRAAAGNEKDPENCVLAKACRQQLRSRKVLFFRSVAYVHHPGKDGVDRVYRYMIGDAARAIIAAFDRGQEVAGNVLVRLMAPKPSESLDGIRTRWKRNQKKKTAKIVGTLTKNNYKGSPFKKGIPKDITIRSGTGMVHMVLKK